MALSRVKTWVAAEVLYAADLNAEFNNVLNNPMSLISPLTSNLDVDGLDLTDIGELAFADESADPSAEGRLRRNGDTLTYLTSDTRTNTTARPLAIQAVTSGTPAASIGVGMRFDAESADENPSNFGALDFVATDIDAGSEDTVLDVLLRVGGAALTSVYRFVSTAAFKAIFTHANTADRTYTLPNASTNLVGHDTTDTLSNKTLTTPTIGSFVNATHNHSNAAGGGVLPAKFYLAPTAGILPSSNPATIALNTGTNWTDYTLDYDTTTQESAFWHVVLPSGQAPSGASVDIFSRTAASTAGTVGWVVTTLTRASGEAWDTSGNADTVLAATVPGTAGQVLVQTASLTTTGWAGSEMLAVKIARNVSGDTMTQDAKFMGAVIRLS